MKKRVCSLLLTMALLLGVLPAMTRSASAVGDDTWGQSGNGSHMTLSEAPSAVNWQLTLKVKPNGLPAGDVYAMVLPKATFDQLTLTAINADTYNKPDKLTLSTGGTVSANELRNADMAYALNGPDFQFTMNLYKLFSAEPNKRDTTYHKEYAFVLFSSGVGTGAADGYLVGSFWMDNFGNTGTRDKTYMVCYLYNADSIGSSQATGGAIDANQITATGGSTALKFSGDAGFTLTRSGYTFLGWDKNKNLMGNVPNTAAASTTRPAYTADGTRQYPGTDTANNQIYDLYATWKPIQVTIAPQAEAMGELRVGVPFTYTTTLGGADGTTKTLSVPDAAEAQWLAKHNLHISGNTIAGTPSDWTDAPKSITFRVTDGSNKTTADLTVEFSKIEKGLQPAPDEDVNTGLQSRIVSLTPGPESSGLAAAEAGQIYGFYSAGQTEEMDRDGKKMTDGSGTYTSYYLDKGMIYEYRPIKLNGADIIYENPTDGWRTIPAPLDKYPEENREALKAALAGKNVITTITGGVAAYTTEDIEGGSWPDGYGEIIFDGTLPVVTGLNKDDVYEIHFRGQANYDMSPATPITVGGAAASSGPSDYSVLFNLMGGKVFKVTTTPPDTEGGEPVVTEVDVTEQLFGQPLTGLKAGDTVNLPMLTLAANERLEFRKEGSTFAGFYDGTTTYTPEDIWSFTMPTYSVGLAAMWGASGEIDPNAVAAVTLFDWDNSYLGSVTVVKGATNEQVMATIDAYCTSNTAIAAALAGKDGYAFTHWVDNDYTGLLAWGEKAKVSSSSGGTLENIEEPPHASFEAVSKNMTVKAAYKAAGVVDNTSAALRNYSFDTEVNYNKMGTSNYYSITVTVKRRNSAGNGVQRMATPAVRVQMTTSAGAMYQLVYLDETDTATATFAVNAANTTTVLCGVIDTYGITAWSSGAAARGTVTLRAGTPTSPGFIYYGSLTFVNEQVAPGGTIGQVTLAVLQDNLGLDLSSVLNNAVTARTYIQAARNTKGSNLTIAEMQYAIEHDGAWQGG